MAANGQGGWVRPVAAALAIMGLCGCSRQQASSPTATGTRQPLRVVVMDPLALPLSCDCVPGYGQRRYDRLATFLEARLGRNVQLAFTESLAEVLRLNPGKVHVIIGKRCLVSADAAEARLPVRPIALLTDRTGRTTLTGLFVVRAGDAAKTVADLAGRDVLLGPAEDREKHAAALAALGAAGIKPAQPPRISPADSTAAIDVVEGKADAAVVSSHAPPLLEGCGVIDPGSLRVVGKTRPVPFITVFATADVSPADERGLMESLLAVRDDAGLLEALESSGGFVPPAAETRPTGWTDWRGPGRAGVSADVPDRLPARPRVLWQRELTGLGLSGVAATGRYVLVADKDEAKTRDIWRCLRAADGNEAWALRYLAAGEMDYSNSPRATPVVHDGLVYLLGGFGDLHCVRLDGGQVVWRMNVVRRFGAKLTQWGLCSTPLIAGDRLIVNPGAKDASLVALDRRTGKVLWTSPGRQSAYASFVLAAPRGVRQVIGYDATTLGGWDVRTGKRLWTLVPDEEGDFNVPTPIVAGERLLVVSENNGARLYAFDATGRLQPTPVATHEDLAPDTQTPVVLAGRAFGARGDLFCLDLANGLKTLWQARDEAFEDYSALIAGNGRVLMLTVDGQLLLIRADGEKYDLLGRLRLYGDEETEIFSHPALIGDRLYVRNDLAVSCFLLK